MKKEISASRPKAKNSQNQSKSEQSAQMELPILDEGSYSIPT